MNEDRTLYPILKRYNESLALGYVGFRLIAAAFIVIGVILIASPPVWT